MKLKNKQKAKAFYPLIFVLVAFLFVSLGFHTSSGNIEGEQSQTYSYIFPKSSDMYITQVEIDDLSTNNWTWAKNMGYCIGSGTEEDPYVIGNDTFSFASGDALIIKNSIKPFKITNCTFNDSNSAGLLLNNVTNCLLINNTAYNNHHGIRIYESWNINVTECIFDSNDQYGLYLDHSDNITMLLNTIVGKHDGDTGITLSYSHYNLIVNNTVSKVKNSPIAIVL